MIGEQISQYRIEERLGEGGMGVVYRAVDTTLDRSVALKFLPASLSSDEEAKARFVQEAKAASGLDHPNICTIHQIGEAEDGRLFIAMACYDGQTLKYALRDGAMEPERAAGIAAQIADGLRKAHAAGIVHRDVKPANIMVTTEGRVKILDFGVAKLAGGADLTKAGSTVGTTAYMSPEQAKGEPVDTRSDLWSLGVLLYEMLSGKKPFGGEYEQAVFYSVLNENPDPLPDSVPVELAGVVTKLLAKSSAERFQSAEDVLHALEPWADSKVRTAVRAPVASAPPLISNRWATITGGILLIAVLIWLFVPTRVSEPVIVDGEFDHVAVLPFTVQGDESLAYLRDGMVTLLSGMLDGAGPIRSIDANQVRGYMERNPEFVIDPEGGRTIAAALGADRYVIGTLVQAGTARQLEATLYDASGANLAGGQSSFTGEETFMPAVDALARQLIGGQLEDPDSDLLSLASATTKSVDALKFYLQAEQAIHNSEWNRAIELADAALEEDSTFALAYYVKSVAFGWVPDFEAGKEAAIAAYRHVGDLDGSLRMLIEGSYYFDSGRPYEAERVFRRMVREYPNDVRGIGELAETLIHYQRWFLKDLNPEREAWNLFRRVIELEPGNSEFQYHLAHSALQYGGTALVDSLASVVETNRSYYSGIIDFLESAAADPDAYLRARPALDAVFNGLEFAFSNDDYRIGIALSDYLVSNDFNFSNRAVWEERTPANIFGAAGQLERQDVALHTDTTPQKQIHALVVDVFETVLPGFECCSQSIETLRSRIRDFDPGPPEAYEGEYFVWHEAVRDYLNGLLSWKAGERESLEQYANTLTNRWSDEGPFVESLEHELRGLIAWLDEDLEAALDHLHRSNTEHNWAEVFGTVVGRPTVLFFAGELLVELGRYEEALRYFEHAFWSSTSQFLVPSVIRQAEIFELTGNLEEAVKQYERIGKIWLDADEALQPVVDQALARRDELLIQLGREPSDLPVPGT